MIKMLCQKWTMSRYVTIH